MALRRLAAPVMTCLIAAGILVGPPYPLVPPFKVDHVSTAVSPRVNPAGPVDHIFVILMENQSYKDVMTSREAPFLRGLGRAGAVAADYRSPQYGSLANYLDIFAGKSLAGRVWDDCRHCHTRAPNLAQTVTASGRTWKGYMEDLPKPGYLGVQSGDYVKRHDPFVVLDSVIKNPTQLQRVVPLGQLRTDLRSSMTTPNLVVISGNQCSDMHTDCNGEPIRTGDNFSRAVIGDTILSSPAWQESNSLLVVVFDEGSHSDGTRNRVPFIVVGPSARSGHISNTRYNHFSLTKSIESIWSLPGLAENDAAARPMADLFRRGTVANPRIGRISDPGIHH